MAERLWNSVFEARQNLNDYIDALCTGRDVAAEGTEGFYIERLAVAAQLAALLDRLSTVATVRQIIRKENDTFKRDILITEHGRNVRAKFNLLARAAVALEDYQAPDGSIPTGPQSLVGESLSSVTFVNDYVQLDFNGQGFSVYCPIVVHSERGTFRSWCDGFRDCLCEAIDQGVESVEVGKTKVDISLSRCRIELLYAEDKDSRDPLIFTNRDQRVDIYIESDQQF